MNVLTQFLFLILISQPSPMCWNCFMTFIGLEIYLLPITNHRKFFLEALTLILLPGNRVKALLRFYCSLGFLKGLVEVNLFFSQCHLITPLSFNSNYTFHCLFQSVFFIVRGKLCLVALLRLLNMKVCRKYFKSGRFSVKMGNSSE